MLRALIEALADQFGRDIRILDVGGRPDYWQNVGFGRIDRIDLLNLESAELDRPLPAEVPRERFVAKVGDARDLGDYADDAVDLVHSNSVIEHVGGWDDMAAMARELQRVGRAGWVQTPAFGFPLEPHFRVPFAHWLGRPLQARLMSLSFLRNYREADPVSRRKHVDRINLLTRREVETLFPGRAIHTERIIFAKSYSVHWLPADASSRAVQRHGTR
jgi:hypothetical protein